MTNRILPILVAFLFVGSNSAFAHGLGLEAKLKGDKIRVEAFFDDDTPCRDGKVTVEDEEKNVLLEGKTDSMGAWEFPIPKPGKYRIIVDGGDGHKTRRWLTIPEPEAAPEAATTVSDGPTRNETTGMARYVWAAVGLAAISAVGFLVWFFLQRKKLKPDSNTNGVPR